MKILVINGPNLNLLEKRNQQVYGQYDLESINKLITKEFPEIEFEFFQSNDEYNIISKIQNAPKEFNGLVINPGGFSHSSIGLRDALELCTIPKIEVHLSNLATREKFRTVSLTASVCDGYVSGFKHNSYLVGIYAIQKIIFEKKN